MDRQDILRLRNELVEKDLGILLMQYIQDYITAEGCKYNRSGDCIKGMCEIAQLIKDIPSKV